MKEKIKVSELLKDIINNAINKVFYENDFDILGEHIFTKNDEAFQEFQEKFEKQKDKIWLLISENLENIEVLDSDEKKENCGLNIVYYSFRINEFLLDSYYDEKISYDDNCEVSVVYLTYKQENYSNEQIKIVIE
ncbi:hypothetical protein ACEE95_06930 [Clostridium baratii]